LPIAPFTSSLLFILHLIFLLFLLNARPGLNDRGEEFLYLLDRIILDIVRDGWRLRVGKVRNLVKGLTWWFFYLRALVLAGLRTRFFYGDWLHVRKFEIEFCLLVKVITGANWGQNSEYYYW
jgi:hypothetical protein